MSVLLGKTGRNENTSLQYIVLDSCNEAVLAWRKENKKSGVFMFFAGNSEVAVTKVENGY